MESRLAREAQADLLEIMRRLTPEQKLDAFLRHCRLVTKLYNAGRDLRAQPAGTTHAK